MTFSQSCETVDVPVDRCDPCCDLDLTGAVRHISLNDLPSWCAHAGRLLAGAPPASGRRTGDSVLRNYEQHYARLLEYLDRADGDATMEDVRRFQADITSGVDGRPAGVPSHRCCVSFGDALYEMDDAAAQERSVELVIESIAGAGNDWVTLVELGAGYGYFLHRLADAFPGKKLCGADFSATAVELARRIFRDDPRLSFHQFDFDRPDSYRFLETLDPPLLVITHHAVEQAPSAAVMIDALSVYRDRIGGVMHFEPLYVPDDRSLLGILRRRYTEHQGYNRDLLAEIERRPDVRLRASRMNVIGRNPIHPTSVLHWDFAD